MLIDGYVYVLDKVLLKIKEIVGTEKFHDTIILIDTDDKPPHDVTLKNVVILITYVIKDGEKLYQQLFLAEEFYDV